MTTDIRKYEEVGMLGKKDIIAFIPTRDRAKSRRFYTEVVGLTFKEQDAFADVVDANGIDIRIVDVGPDFVPAGFTILGWAVEDIQEAVTTLRSKGVEFETYAGMDHDEFGIWTARDGAKVAWFKDPDGNMLSVSQDTE